MKFLIAITTFTFVLFNTEHAQTEDRSTRFDIKVEPLTPFATVGIGWSF